MNKRRKKQVQHIRLEHGFFWVGLAVILALLSAGMILRVVQQPTTPSIMVVSPITYSEGGDAYLPGTGRNYAVIEIELKNPTVKVFNFAPVLQAYLTDEQGNRYDMAPVELDNPIAAGEIQPNETRRGQLSFNVPKDTSALTFHFETTDEYQLSYTHRL